MSTASRSDPPQYLNNTTDFSHHETSYGGFNNYGIHLQEGTVILTANDPSKPLGICLLAHIKYPTSENQVDRLRAHCSPGVTFDSLGRDPPRCAESTRVRILQRLERWISEERPDGAASLFWLYGGVGVGKSALAQTLAEKSYQHQKLAATYFFRDDTSRNDGVPLIPTLISQLVSTFKGLCPFVEEKISTDPDLFTKQHLTQIQELLVEPLRCLKSTKPLSSIARPSLKPMLNLISKEAPGSRPRLIVIDGLDKCQDPEGQCILLRAIANAIPRIPYPLRFLVTSRPEPHILHVFNHDIALQDATADRYNLNDDPDADMDICRFFEKKFEEIRHSHCLSNRDWPDKNSVALLVERSSKHFIYPETVIQYIRSTQHRPSKRLEVILRTPLQRQDHPFAQLDARYSLIFQDVKSHDLQKIWLVLGIVYVHTNSGVSQDVPYSECSTIERMLGMKAGGVKSLLSQISSSSLVAIKNEKVQILQKSVIEYLLDPTRCGHSQVPFDLAWVHDLAATYILNENLLAKRCTIFEFANFAYHCRFGYLSDNLKDYLRGIEPYPECIKPPLDTPLMMIMSTFFQALSRDDFDPTGQYHALYAAKWMSYLCSAVPGCDQPQDSMPSWLADPVSKGDSLKDRLDTMLKEWKPKNFKSTNKQGKIPDKRLAIIEEEHLVFSTFIRALALTADSTALSSLVFGDDFVYSYHIMNKQRSNPYHCLVLLAYARHENVCDDNQTWNLDIFMAMRTCLESAEKFFLSDPVYRKYGIFH